MQQKTYSQFSIHILQACPVYICISFGRVTKINEISVFDKWVSKVGVIESLL